MSSFGQQTTFPSRSSAIGRSTRLSSAQSDGTAQPEFTHPSAFASRSSAGARSTRMSVAQQSDAGSAIPDFMKDPAAAAAAAATAAAAAAEIIAAQESEIAWLREQQQDLERRIAHLETESQLASAAALSTEDAHSQELQRVQKDVQRALGERRSLLDKLHGVEVIEDAVRELYVQMKDRTAEDESPTPEELQAEKDALKGENILVVLGALHAVLKNLWAFKVEAEQSMRGRVELRSSRGQAESLALKEQMRAMEAAVRHALAEAAKHKQRAEAEACARQDLLEESHAQVEQMKTSMQEMVETLKATHSQGEAYKRAMQQAYEEGRKRDGLVLRNKHLESARHFDRVAQDKELRQLQYEHNFQLASMAKELDAIGSLENKLADAQAAAEKYKRQIRERDEVDDQRRRNIRKELGSAHARPAFPLEPAAAHGQTLPATGSWVGESGAHTVNASARSRTQQGSMSQRASELLESMHARTLQQVKDNAEKEVDDNPVYRIISNVNRIHKQTRATLKEMKRDATDNAGSFRARIDDALEKGTEYSATAALPTARAANLAKGVKKQPGKPAK